MSLVARALARWGKTDPTPDDVISEVYPHYTTNKHHKEMWHIVAREVVACAALIEPDTTQKYCLHCEQPLQGRQKHYCSTECMLEYRREQRKHSLPPRVCEVCGVTVYPSAVTKPCQWRRSRFCRSCANPATIAKAGL
jgi:methionyl-tRNA synthetase